MADAYLDPVSEALRAADCLLANPAAPDPAYVPG
jgi:hypothetical protein